MCVSRLIIGVPSYACRHDVAADLSFAAEYANQMCVLAFLGRRGILLNGEDAGDWFAILGYYKAFGVQAVEQRNALLPELRRFDVFITSLLFE